MTCSAVPPGSRCSSCRLSAVLGHPDAVRESAPRPADRVLVAGGFRPAASAASVLASRLSCRLGVVVGALVGEVLVERLVIGVAHPGVVVGDHVAVELADRRHARRHRRCGRLARRFNAHCFASFDVQQLGHLLGGQAVRGVAVPAGDRGRGEHAVEDGLLGRLDDGGEERVQSPVRSAAPAGRAGRPRRGRGPRSPVARRGRSRRCRGAPWSRSGPARGRPAGPAGRRRPSRAARRSPTPRCTSRPAAGAPAARLRSAAAAGPRARRPRSAARARRSSTAAARRRCARRGSAATRCRCRP